MKHYNKIIEILNEYFKIMNATTETVSKFEDQETNISEVKIGDYTLYIRESINTKENNSTSFICWLTKSKENCEINLGEIADPQQKWLSKAIDIWQIRGDNKIGFQAQEISAMEDGELVPLRVYESNRDGVINYKSYNEIGFGQTCAIDENDFYSLLNNILELIKNCQRSR